MDGEEKSLDEILGASLSDAYDAAEAVPDSEAADTETDAAPADGQPRDEHGRFTAKTGQAAQDAPAEGAEGTVQNTDQGQTQAAAPVDPASEPPASWSAAEKAIWPTLPPDVRATIARREADFAKGIEQKAQGLKAYEALETVLAPRRPGLTAEYGSVENAVSTLFKLSDFAAQDKPGFVRWFCQAHNLDPQTIFGGATDAAPQPGQDGQTASPELAAVRAELDSLKNELVRAVQEPVIRQAQTELQKFEAEAPTKYPHYSNPQVKSEMAAILRNGNPDMTFEQAYDRVVWSMPELRQQLLEAERKAAIEAQSKAAAEAAKKARQAAGPQLRAVGNPGEVRAAPRSIDETLSAVYDRSQGVA